MDNIKQFNAMPSDDNWRSQNYRQGMVARIEDMIQRSGIQVGRNSSDMEGQVFQKAKTKEEYMNMIAKLLLHFRDISQSKQNQSAQNMQNQNQQNSNAQVQNQGQQSHGPNNQGGLATDPINALQNMASQGTRNQMMNMGPQGQMQQQMGPNPGMGGMQGQMGQQPIVSQGQQSQTATNLLQTLNQRPQLNMQLQNKLAPMGMVPNQGQMGNNMMGGMGSMGSQLQSQLGAPGMQPQMMSMSSGMQGPMGSGMGQMQQLNPNMGGQMAPNSMQGQMNQQMVGGMGGNQMVNMGMLHMQGRVPGKQEVMLGGGYPAGRAPQPGQFLRQSPSPSAPSPGMGGPSPASMGVMGGAMPSPMSLGALGACAGVGSPSPSGPQHMTHHSQQQRGVGMGMVASPSSSVNTPAGAGGGGGGGAGGGGGGGGGGASPGGEEAAYREKVRQLSKYIEPLKRMVHRMVSEGENVEKLTKIKNLLDIISNPNKRMPLETLIKCEVVLEKLDFKRSEGVGLGLPAAGKEQIFNPLLEVVNLVLQSPSANHTLKRTFGHTLDAINGPEIKNVFPPPKRAHRQHEAEQRDCEIPDVLQGEIARLDSRFKVSLDPMQPVGAAERGGGGGGGAVTLVAQLDDARLPCVPGVHVAVPRGYPAAAPERLRPRHAPAPPGGFLARVERAMDARCARLPKACSVSQILDAFEMSVRQACAPGAAAAPVPALGL